MTKPTDDLDTYRGFAPATITTPSGRHRGEPAPATYGHNPTPALLEQVEAERVRLAAQRARRHAARSAR